MATLASGSWPWGAGSPVADPSGQYVYATGAGGVFRVPRTGGPVQVVIPLSPDTAHDAGTVTIVPGAEQIVWTEIVDTECGAIRSAHSDGSNATVIRSRLEYVNAIAVVPVTDPRPAPNALFLPRTAAAAGSFVTIPGRKKLVTGFDDGITVAAWVKTSGWPADGAGERTIIANGTFALRVVGGRYECGMLGAAGDAVSAAVPAGDDGTWVHLAGTYDRGARRARAARRCATPGSHPGRRCTHRADAYRPLTASARRG